MNIGHIGQDREVIHNINIIAGAIFNFSFEI